MQNIFEESKILLFIRSLFCNKKCLSNFVIKKIKLSYDLQDKTEIQVFLNRTIVKMVLNTTQKNYKLVFILNKVLLLFKKVIYKSKEDKQQNYLMKSHKDMQSCRYIKTTQKQQQNTIGSYHISIKIKFSSKTDKKIETTKFIENFPNEIQAQIFSVACLNHYFSKIIQLYYNFQQFSINFKSVVNKSFIFYLSFQCQNFYTQCLQHQFMRQDTQTCIKVDNGENEIAYSCIQQMQLCKQGEDHQPKSLIVKKNDNYLMQEAIRHAKFKIFVEAISNDLMLQLEKTNQKYGIIKLILKLKTFNLVIVLYLLNTDDSKILLVLTFKLIIHIFSVNCSFKLLHIKQ
ncbi:hypothetical protein pb186bvf_019010 [Paramecium bursaria]